MRQILVLTNFVLTILAVLLTVYLLNTNTEANISVEEPQLLRPQKPSKKKREEFVRELEPMRAREMDVVWERNLFHPDRTYEEVIPGIEITNEEEVTEHFELISIAQVGAISCASIRVISSKDQRNLRNRRNRRNVRDRRRRRRTPNRSRRAPRQQRTDENQKIYKLNDPVGETGFKLTAIEIGSVVLTKDEQEITLNLDKSDEASLERQEEALKTEEKKAIEVAAAKRRQKEEAKEAENEKSKGEEPESEQKETTTAEGVPPPPPPPPPPPRAGLANPPAPTAGQSRRKTRQQLRRQYLDKIRQENSEGSDSR